MGGSNFPILSDFFVDDKPCSSYNFCLSDTYDAVLFAHADKTDLKTIKASDIPWRNKITHNF